VDTLTLAACTLTCSAMLFFFNFSVKFHSENVLKLVKIRIFAMKTQGGEGLPSPLEVRVQSKPLP
jgi:hypothetical protein